MKNTITKSFIGKTFIDWARNNYDVGHQHDMFFSLFEKACSENKVDLYVNGEDTIRGILCKNRKTITYVEGVDSMVNYLCEDSCHKLHGFNALTDIVFPYLYDDALGGIIMYKYEDYKKINVPEEIDWLDSFATYLCPKIMDGIVAMTREYMGDEVKKISDDTLKSVWGDIDNSTTCEWIAQFNDLVIFNDADSFIGDYLNMNVIHGAIGNVIGADKISDDKYMQVYNNLVTEPWDELVELWSGNVELIDSVREYHKIAPEKVTMCGHTWDKIDKDLRNETDGGEKIWWKVGEFSEGELWEENLGGRLFLINSKGEMFVTYF